MTHPITQWNRLASANSVERLVADRAEKAEKADKGAAAPAAAAPAQDELQLSAVARQASAEEPTIDRAKVDAIKQALQNGQYPLDARRMAESFMALEQMIRD